MIRQLIIAALLSGVAVPALALEEPKPGKKDPRMLTAPYDPSNPIHIWSAVGAVFMVRFADDEVITKVHGADVATKEHPDHALAGDYDKGPLLFFKFQKCMIPQMVFAVTVKAGGEKRTYPFQVETHPQICSTKIPAPETSVSGPKQGTPTLISSANAAEAQAADLPTPDLSHLPRPDALMIGGGIPWGLTITYPGDEAAKRRAAAQVRRAAWEKRETHELLQQRTVEPENQAYQWIGDPNLKPARAWDDYSTTTLWFPGTQAIPVATKLVNAAIKCGESKQNEAVVDVTVKDFVSTIPGSTLPIHGNAMTIPGTAQAWCLRSAHAVTELWNSQYTTGRAWPTGTGTSAVQRVIRGGADDN